MVSKAKIFEGKLEGKLEVMEAFGRGKGVQTQKSYGGSRDIFWKDIIYVVAHSS